MTNDKGKYSQYLTVAGNYFANKGWVHLLLAGGLYILYKMFFRTSLPFFLTISSLPLMTVIFLLIIKYSKQSFYTLFISIPTSAITRESLKKRYPFNALFSVFSFPAAQAPFAKRLFP